MSSQPRPAQAVVGIDLGGSSTRARCLTPAGTVLSGVGGPANVRATSPARLQDAVRAATAGFPEPAAVVVCAAGAGTDEIRGRVREALTPVFPDARWEVRPDYDASLALLTGDADVAVVVGTGSVVVSEVGGETLVTGGAGWILGDPGSAADLGQRLLRAYFEAPTEMDPAVVRAIAAALGVTEPREILPAVHQASAPGSALARVAPVLTAAAGRGEPWALALVQDSARALARGVAYHLRQRGERGVGGVRLGLLGGLWESAEMRRAFADALGDLGAGDVLVVDLHAREPVAGALGLATRLARQ